jgi:hypothetical protein
MQPSEDAGAFYPLLTQVINLVHEVDGNRLCCDRTQHSPEKGLDMLRIAMRFERRRSLNTAHSFSVDLL